MRNVIELNTENGINCNSNSSIIENNTIFGNKKSGIYTSKSGQRIVNNIFYGNDEYGVAEKDASTDPDSCIFNCYFNNGKGLYLNEGNTPITTLPVLHAFVPECKTNWYSNNSINEDPKFVDAAAGDYHLQPDSPCIDRGHPNSPKDPDLTRTDMGAYDYRQGIVIEPNHINFGTVEVGESRLDTAKVINRGETAQHITSVSITGANSGNFSINTTPFSLAAYDTVFLPVTFTPDGDGTFEAILKVASDSDSAAAQLIGIGVIDGPIFVSIPADSAAPGQFIDIPVNVSDVTNRGVKSFGLTVEIDPAVLIPNSTITGGTIAESWGNPTYNISNRQIIITMAGTTPLSGSGALIFIRYQVNPAAEAYDTTTIHIANVEFNQGDPPAKAVDGLFTVIGFDITGSICYYPDSLGVNDAIVPLTGAVNLTDTTDVAGSFEFLHLPRGNYMTKPEKENGLGNAITPYDAALTLQYYVGLIELSPYQKIAGDVSGNDNVAHFDASLILQYYVGLIDSFPLMPDATHFWTFVPLSFPIDDTNWFTAPDSLLYEPLNSNQTQQDFAGIIYGDVSGNWKPSGVLAKTGTFASKFTNFRLGKAIRMQDNTLSVPVRVDAGSELISAGIILKFDQTVLKLLSISATELTSGYSLVHNSEDSRIKIALAGTEPLEQAGAIAELKFKALKPAAGGLNPLSLEHVILNEGGIAANIQQSQFSLALALPTEYALSQNFPNPFNPNTTIKYQLPGKCSVTMKVFNLMGQEIRTLVDEERAAGFHTVHWDGKDSAGKRVASGVYVYRIQAGSFVQNKKMAILK